MTNGIVVSFGRVHGRRARDVTDALAELLAVAGATLRGCDVGFSRDSRALLAVMRCAESPGRPLVGRVAFWCARAGGVALSLSDVTPGTRASIAETLERSEVKRLIAADAISEGVEVFAAAAGLRSGARVVARAPVLRLSAGGPGWDAVAYDSALRQLFVPSPLAPPVGDAFDLMVGSPGRDGVVAVGRARVVAVRDPFDAAQDAPAGFSIRVDHGPDMHRLLMRTCRASPALGGRAAPRYRVAGRVRIRGPEPVGTREQFIETLSHRGAFIRTSASTAPGTSVHVEMPLPYGDVIELPARVVHQRPDGIGIRFEDGPPARERLNAVITELAGAARRILIVDDDALSRRMLADALQARGFDVVAEPDALAGLSRLAEEILALDLLVTDVIMPDVDGEELVRRIREVGGERDLPILAVTARLDNEVERRLKRAGADAVVSKLAGPEALADAAEHILAADDQVGVSSDDKAAEPVSQSVRTR